MKVLSVVGARPQFIKLASIDRAIQRHNQGDQALSIQHVIVHTGQHYDPNMSDVFFEELHIPKSDHHLAVGSGLHGQQTGRMLEAIEMILLKEKPDIVLGLGDTNSTLAGALAAAKLHLPVAHVEAGVRSFNRQMPEEVNRLLTDHISDWLFCPTETAVENLSSEGINEGVYFVGDVMYDAVLYNVRLAEDRSDILDRLNLVPESYALATVHRPENTDDPLRLKSIFCALDHISQNGIRVIVPLHPRTCKKLSQVGGKQSLPHLDLIDPVSYLDMLLLEKHAKFILTDSGGVQKEAYWFDVPCITLRNETEWVETVAAGWNTLVGSNHDLIVEIASELTRPSEKHQRLYGDGRAAMLLVNCLSEK